VTAAGATSGPLEWGTAARALPGEDESGDRALVLPRGAGGVLVAVIDGLGHGDEASLAAQLAVDTISEDPEEDLVEMVCRCHERLVRTRGAVVAVADVQPGGGLQWTGVGNIEAVLVRADGGAREHALLFGGVLGMQVPRLRPSRLRLEPGDWLILATDGIARGFTATLELDEPQAAADRILARHAVTRDDALVFVGRYGGDGR
jgi:phosphoserine phosphatase RsbX